MMKPMFKTDMRKSTRELIEDKEKKHNCIILTFFDDESKFHFISVLFLDTGKVIDKNVICDHDNVDAFEVGVINFFKNL